LITSALSALARARLVSGTPSIAVVEAGANLSHCARQDRSSRAGLHFEPPLFDIRPQLFEPFFTNKPNGTGLGLSISAHIIIQHEQIEVESAEGQASTFCIVLPYHSDR
jgi:light-regulated signal transduction histidine kinase (bacteriophytochrome)